MRSRSFRLNFSSRARTCWLTADCVTKFLSAASEKLCVSTRSQKIFKVSICMAQAIELLLFVRQVSPLHLRVVTRPTIAPQPEAFERPLPLTIDICQDQAYLTAHPSGRTTH